MTSPTVVLPRRDDQRERASDEQLVEEREEDKDHGEAVRRHMPLLQRSVQVPRRRARS